MVISGRMHDGVVILEQGTPPPEGAAVSIMYPALPTPKPPEARRRIEVPLVHTRHPGSLHLTGARIAQILDDEDASPRR